MTNLNPIIAAVAQAATVMDRPIASVSVTAPLISGTPTLVIVWSSMLPQRAHEIDTRDGVSVLVLAKPDDTVRSLPPMIDIETHIIEAAWTYGAWDIARTAIAAGYDGPLPPDAVASGNATALRQQGWVTWTWRPMLRGPEIRARQRHPDVTLDPWHHGRTTPPPNLTRSAIKGGQQTVIRLGAATPDQPKLLPATPKQRAYLIRLLAAIHDTTPIPSDLDRRQASSWIDSLTGETPPEPSKKPRKRTLMITINQWRLIDHLRRCRREPGLPPGVMRAMTYDEAAAMIANLKACP